MTTQATMLTDESVSLAFHEQTRQKFGRGALTPEYAQEWFRLGARFASDRYEADRAKLLDRIAEDAKVREKLELALTAAVDRMCSEGCDCGTDEPGTCALCVCEAALVAAKERG